MQRRDRGRQQPRAIDEGGLYGAPIIGGDVNLTDMGHNDPDWYDMPEWQRTELMRQAKLRLDKAREDDEKRRAQEDAERLSAMHAPRKKEEEKGGQEHYAELGLYPFQEPPERPGERAIDQASTQMADASYPEDR